MKKLAQKLLLSKIVCTEVNSLNDIENCGNGVYNIVDLPQTPSYLDNIIKCAKSEDIDVFDFRKAKTPFLKLAVDETNWIRFNLYECDEPNYGKRGDVNSLDISENFYRCLKSMGIV